MRDSSVTADAAERPDALVDDAASSPTSTATAEAPRGLDRRSFLGKAAVVGAGTAVLSSGVLAGSARAAAAPASNGAAVLPTVASVNARLKTVRLVDLEILELAALLQARQLSAVDLAQAYFARIDALNGPFENYQGNGGYNAFVRVDKTDALASAKAADARLDAAAKGGDPAPYLCGIPMGVKDSIGLKGRPAQDGSAAFVGNIANEDAPAMARLRAQGVVFLGHTICSEFSGSTTGTFAGNAWQPDFFPGGSSQGSGVAPVARLAAGAIGEETGGSIIFPSAANGASGIKPSLGLSSVAGLMPLTPGHDVIGPISRSMADSALILNAMLGPDPTHDPQTLSPPIPFDYIPMTPTGGAKPLAGLTIGVPKTDWMGAVGTDPQSRYSAENLAVFNRVRGQLETLGATVVEFQNLDMSKTALNTYFSSPDVLETVDGSAVSPSSAVRYPALYEIRYAEAVKQFVADKGITATTTVGTPPVNALSKLLGNYGRRATGEAASSFDSATRLYAGVSTGARREGERRRRQTAANYKASLDAAGVDFMLVMNFGTKINRRVRAQGEAGVVSRTYYQVPNALAWPMLSFPAGYSADADGLPISVQFWAPRFEEPTIVQAAIDFQAAYPEYHRAIPKDRAYVPLPVTTAAKRREQAASPDASTAGSDVQDPFYSDNPEVHDAAIPDALRPH